MCTQGTQMDGKGAVTGIPLRGSDISSPDFGEGAIGVLRQEA